MAADIAESAVAAGNAGTRGPAFRVVRIPVMVRSPFIWGAPRGHTERAWSITCGDGRAIRPGTRAGRPWGVPRGMGRPERVPAAHRRSLRWRGRRDAAQRRIKSAAPRRWGGCEAATGWAADPVFRAGMRIGRRLPRAGSAACVYPGVHGAGDAEGTGTESAAGRPSACCGADPAGCRGVRRQGMRKRPRAWDRSRSPSCALLLRSVSHFHFLTQTFIRKSGLPPISAGVRCVKAGQWEVSGTRRGTRARSHTGTSRHLWQGGQ
ncbi:hypothetical protein Tbis_3392 [Thermobispora bispora DSM 43833]|uniref:Uncharacterized protein n=1 Tax=Thermobispora bispora (strain ATCC 19993 / DSM 43833 / CBS 139.67 / JCM 10125 / KCTC 9307 / NBRC 14880 / R51) TaxID=469371 RepID=D6Y9Q1_THEBD|nr:hypothetical protein Tbis_3392 [Thermobispora bispora DSM 43833]